MANQSSSRPGVNAVVRVAVDELPDALFAQEGVREAEVDGAHRVEALDLLRGQLEGRAAEGVLMI